MNALPRLLVLTDRSQLPPEHDLATVLGRCADAGLTHVLLRELDLHDSERASLVDYLHCLGLTVIAAQRSTPNCAGLHVSADQPPPRPTATIRWGRSCHTAAEVEMAAIEGAQWATLSPFSWTRSKPGYGPPVPAASFADHRIPVYALGGVGPHNAAAARQAGAYGVAAMGAVMQANDPATVISALLREVCL